MPHGKAEVGGKPSTAANRNHAMVLARLARERC
jgi:hypothetical protein